MCADITRTVEIIFGAIDNTGQGLSSVSSNLNSFTNSASNITSPLSDVAEFALKAETAVLSLAVAYGTYAAIKASEFETAQIDLNKVLDETDPKIESFTQTVFDLAETYGQSSASILQGVSNFKQAGFTAQESAVLQKNALDLIVAGDVDAAAASQILISAIKGMSASAADAPRFIEALNNVSNKYATDVPQLADGISRLAPVLKVMGFSFEEGTALLTPLIEVFGDGAQASEALKTGLLKLTDDAKPVQEALQALGVSQLDLNGNMRSGKDIFYDVATAFQTLDENQKLVYTRQLVGIEQAPKMVLAFDNIKKINEITAVAMEHTGSVSKEVELRLASTTIQADILKQSFDNLAIVIGERINTQFGGVVAGSSSVLQAFRGIVESGGLDAFFEALKPQMEAFAQTMQNIAANLPDAFDQVDFSGVIDALKDMGLEIGNIFDGLDLSTTEGLANAIQFVVDSFESLTRVVTGIVTSWDPVVKAFIAGIDEINHMDDASKRTFGSMSGLANVFENLKGTINIVIAIFGTLGASLTTIAGIQASTGIVALGSAVGTAAAAITLALGPMGSIVAAVSAIGFGIAANVVAWDDYKSRQDTVADSTAHLAEAQSSIKDKLADISQSTGVAVSSMDELNKAVDDGRLVFNEATGAYEAAKSGVRDFDAEVAAVAANSGSFEDAVNKVAASIIDAGDASKKAAEDSKALDTAQQDLIRSFGKYDDALKFSQENITNGHTGLIKYADGIYTVTIKQSQATEATKNLTEATNKAGEASKKAAKDAVSGTEEWKRVQDVMLETQKQTDDFTIALGELSNKRYEIDVKASVDLKVAEIEADTARITAAFEASASAIDSLSGGVADLYNSYNDASSFSRPDIYFAANRMESRLDEELRLKELMTLTLVEKMRAETIRLGSGEPLISIDAGSLAPELEMIFDKILKYTQIKATEQGLSMLVGI